MKTNSEILQNHYDSLLKRERELKGILKAYESGTLHVYPNFEETWIETMKTELGDIQQNIMKIKKGDVIGILRNLRALHGEEIILDCEEPLI